MYLEAEGPFAEIDHQWVLAIRTGRQLLGYVIGSEQRVRREAPRASGPQVVLDGSEAADVTAEA
jgi:hypothetical protein